ncbi:MAG: AAA family ATPase [Paludibacteraceae bacterium]|nr:AAA family ATPase [Paludibacteraceae bacterium]
MALPYEEILARRIKPDTIVPQHDFLFRWGNQPCYARGELVALTGKAKSGKTFVCSLLMALAVRPQLMGLSRLHEKPLRVVWIDTEQSEDSTHEILCHRIGSLIGEPIPEDQFFVYNLRRDNWQDRLAWAELCIVQAKPDLVIFDGIRDVVGDINNYTEAQTVLDKLLSLASWTQACIVCVLHQNKALEDKTLRGALGTELQNKSYETYECQKDTETRRFTLRQTATRKYDITDKLEFSVNAEGLPVLSANPLLSSGDSISCNEQSLNATEVFTTVLAGKELRAGDLRAQVKQRFQIRNDDTFKRLFAIAQSDGLIVRRQVSEREVYYSLATPPINDEPELF